MANIRPLNWQMPTPALSHRRKRYEGSREGRARRGRAASFSLPAYADTTLTIATVNNGDMIEMQKLTDDFTKANPDIKLNWVTLEENVLRQKVTTDIATKGGQFDVITIGTYEVPIWAKKNWLVPLDKLGVAYDFVDPTSNRRLRRRQAFAARF